MSPTVTNRDDFNFAVEFAGTRFALVCHGDGAGVEIVDGWQSMLEKVAEESGEDIAALADEWNWSSETPERPYSLHLSFEDGSLHIVRLPADHTPPASPNEGAVITVVWRAAMTAAINILIKRQNDLNDDDGPMDVLNEQGACIGALKRWLEPDEIFLSELRRMVATAAARAVQP